MNNNQLQEAIDKAREFMQLESMPGGVLHSARQNTQKTLAELERIQVMRAGMMLTPKIMKVSE